jgi:Domain of unknown function (DUF4388)/Type II secretion system (T2SS), protein G
MALEGRIKDFGLADIFQLIHLQKKTGVLTVKNEQQKATILFEEGMIVGAETSARRTGDRLGELLMKTQKLTKAQLNEALRLQQQHGEKFGKILEQKGWIKKEELTRILQIQIQEMIGQLFLLQEGDYAFEQKTVEYNREYMSPMNTEFILLEGVRRVDEWPGIKKLIPSLDIVFESSTQDKNKIRVKAEGENAGGALGEEGEGADQNEITQGDFQILDLVDGFKDVKTIIEFTQRGEFETCKTLAMLLRSGLIHVKETGKKDSTKVKTAYESTSRVIGDTVREAVKWTFSALSYIILIALAVLAYGYRENLQVSLNSVIGGYSALKPVQARMELGNLRTILMMYFLENHSYPLSLDQLVSAGYLSSESIQDPWGHPLQYERLATGYKLLSNGEDGRTGTEDDIY